MSEPGENTQPPDPAPPARDADAASTPQFAPIPQGLPPAPPVPPAPAAAPAPFAASSPQPTYGGGQPYGAQHYGAPQPPVPQYGAQPQHPFAQPQHPYAVAPPQAGYAPPPQGYGPYVPPAQGQTPQTGSRALGLVALLLALAAAVVVPVAGAIVAFNIGAGLARAGVLRSLETMAQFDLDWSLLTPVRDWVLWGEISFWAGTVLGIWAIVQGIVAIARRRGRGAGIAAVVVAAIGPIVFFVTLQLLLAVGFASGSSIGG